jgi:hypothetical protein
MEIFDGRWVSGRASVNFRKCFESSEKLSMNDMSMVVHWPIWKIVWVIQENRSIVDGGKRMRVSSSTCHTNSVSMFHSMSPKLTSQDDVSFQFNSFHIIQ